MSAADELNESPPLISWEHLLRELLPLQECVFSQDLPDDCSRLPLGCSASTPSGAALGGAGLV